MPAASEEGIYPLELKLLMGVGCHVDPGISIETLCKSTKSLTLLGHLAPILFNHDFIIFLMMTFVWGIIVFNVVYLSFNHTILSPAKALEGYFYFFWRYQESQD